MTTVSRLPDLGFELKYAVDARQTGPIRSWLTSVCRRDPIYPTGFVNSLYFDTPDLRHVAEKVNSDYLKTKVRLRWYDAPGAPATTSFLEAKFRVGTRREKVREPIPIDARALPTLSVDDPVFRDLRARLRAHGVPVSTPLRPVLIVRYRRDRFVVPAVAARISLDADIRVPKVGSGHVGAANPQPLRTAVIEVKGPRPELPPVLRPLVQLGGRKVSFSKYLACYDHAVHPHR